MKHQRRVCKFFNSPGGCRNGRRCNFVHQYPRRRFVQRNDGGRSHSNVQPPPYSSRRYDREEKPKRSYPPPLPQPPSGYSRIGPYLIPTNIARDLSSTRQRNQVVRITEKSRMENAKRRLMRDHRDLMKNPLHTVHAAPLRNDKGHVDDIFVWHGNLVGHSSSAWFGVCLHLEMVFSDDYPRVPPKTHESFNRWSGWSTSYSVSSILLQLQNFLFEDEDRYQPLSRDILEEESNRAMRYICRNRKCTHDMTKLKPQPWHRHMYKILPHNQTQQNKYEPKKGEDPKYDSSNPKRKMKRGIYSDIPLEVLRWKILVFLDRVELRKWMMVSKNIRKIVSRMISVEKESLVCFHTKRRYLDPDEEVNDPTNLNERLPERVILGFGITIQRNPHSGLIDYVDTPCLEGYLSYRAYEEMGVRKGVFKQEFREFLPLYLNRFHARRSFPLFCSLISKYTSLRSFHPLEGVEILMKVMNTCIVRVMNGKEHLSEVALTGYFHCFRLVIAVCEKYPWVQTSINDRVKGFIEHEGRRSHKGERNIGNFLQCITISDHSFRDVLPHLLDEQWDRNVKWILKKYPELDLQNIPPSRRILMSWASSIIPCQLVLFNQAFNNLVRPSSSKALSLQEIGSKLDEKYGQPPGYLQRMFQSEVFEIMKISNFTDFFQKLKMKTVKSIESSLLDSFSNSFQRGYHKRKKNGRYVNSFRIRNMNKMRRKPIRQSQRRQQQQQGLFFNEFFNNFNMNIGGGEEEEEKKSWSPWMDRNDSPANIEVLERVRRLEDISERDGQLLNYSRHGTSFREPRFEFLVSTDEEDEEEGEGET